MLNKTAIMLLGIINDEPVNAYEIIKQLEYMNIKWWFNIGDSTVYATIKVLEKKKYICGNIEKIGNMPSKKVYSITQEGIDQLKTSIIEICESFSYDTVLFSIAACYIHVFNRKEIVDILERRLEYLDVYLRNINKQLPILKNDQVPIHHISNVSRMVEIVKAEIIGTKRILNDIKEGNT
ncbi:PadR family transcriptional regulator [Clostridiaceae bacterium M8S5]|nr:PadR family transcriptional regulator [Clostridiaceae bacterium M8S5]